MITFEELSTGKEGVLKILKDIDHEFYILGNYKIYFKRKDEVVIRVLSSEK